MTEELATPGPTAPEEARPGRPVWAWTLLWLGLWVGASAFVHGAIHGVVNGFQVALALFLAINVLVAFQEISLFLRIDDLEERYRRRVERSGGARRPKGRSFFLSRVPFRRLFTADLWSHVWAEYARYDPSYADRRSFGFAIDVGNGFTTLVPSLVFAVGMTFAILPPVWLGILGGLLFYQKFYGTVLYFFTFLFNRRYEGHEPAAVWTFVGAINGVWLVFPAVGLFVSFRLVTERSFEVIWG